MKSLLFKYLLIMCTVCSVNAAVVVLQGAVPQGITSDKLQQEYFRIRSVFQPGFNASEAPVTVIYYTNSEQRRLGVRLPEWGGGGALGQDSIIIPVDKPYAFYSNDYYRITLHELVHIALARSYGAIKIPRWFHEGLAMQLSGEVSFEEGVMLSRAIATRSLVPFDSIELVNKFGQYRAQIAYSQCHFAIQHMTKLYGYDMLPELLDSAKTLRRFDTACVKVFGLTSKEFDAIVKSEMIKKYRYVFIFSDYELLWILVLFLAVAAFVVTLMRNHRKRKKMEADEKLEVEEKNKTEEVSAGDVPECDTDDPNRLQQNESPDRVI